MNNILLSILIMLTFAAMVLPFQGAGVTEAYGFNRDACYATCGCAFGNFTGCMACKQECDRKFWQSFDKQTEDFGDSRPYQSKRSVR